MLKTSNVFLRHLPRSFSTKLSPKGVTLNKDKDKDKDSLKSKAGSKVFIPPIAAEYGFSYKYLYNQAVKKYNKDNPNNKMELITWGIE